MWAVHRWRTIAAKTRRIFTACAGGMCCVDVCAVVRNWHVGDVLGALGAYGNRQMASMTSKFEVRRFDGSWKFGLW